MLVLRTTIAKSLPRLAIMLTLLALISGAFATSVSAHAASDPQFTALNWHPQAHVGQKLARSAMAARAGEAASASQVQVIPTWNSSFNYQGKTYRYTMVGTDPTKGSAITVVPTLIIPLKVVLSDGTVFNGRSKANDLVNSPLFRPSKFTSGYTQYGDAIQRAEFWQAVSTTSSFYHVFLSPPAVLPALTLNVPADKGKPVKAATGTTFGLVDINWLDDQFLNYMQTYHISPKTFPIFLSSDILGTDNNGADCCIGGYHNAFITADDTGVQTYAYGTYNDPGFSAKNPGLFNNTDVLSHEISEWYNDPFVYNEVPNWSVASQPQYGCNNALEVGDPLVGVGFDMGKYHLQDEAFFSWFARQQPSIGIKGQYSYLGTFTDVAQSCTPPPTPTPAS